MHSAIPGTVAAATIFCTIIILTHKKTSPYTSHTKKQDLINVFGLEAMNHIAFTVMPQQDTPAADALSNRPSLVKREIFRKSSITKLRHAIRVYIILLILLENRNDGFVQNQLQAIKTNNENLFTLEGRIRQVWKNYNNNLDYNNFTLWSLPQGNKYGFAEVMQEYRW